MLLDSLVESIAILLKIIVVRTHELEQACVKQAVQRLVSCVRYGQSSLVVERVRLWAKHGQAEESRQLVPREAVEAPVYHRIQTVRDSSAQDPFKRVTYPLRRPVRVPLEVAADQTESERQSSYSFDDFRDAFAMMHDGCRCVRGQKLDAFLRLQLLSLDGSAWCGGSLQRYLRESGRKEMYTITFELMNVSVFRRANTVRDQKNLLACYGLAKCQLSPGKIRRSRGLVIKPERLSPGKQKTLIHSVRTYADPVHTPVEVGDDVRQPSQVRGDRRLADAGMP